jgi:galactokinase/mevalonate kinase-like predicted kinase
MVQKLNATLKRVSADGRLGKKDVEELIKVANDGKGITKAEAERLREIRVDCDKMLTKAAKDGFDAFLGAMNRSWSTKDKVHLPHLDDDKIKALLNSDPRIGIYTGRSGGGKGGSSRPSTPSRPVHRPTPAPTRPGK